MLVPTLLLISLLQRSADTTKLTVAVAPGTPWIEQDPSAPAAPQYLNFDLLIANGGGAPRTPEGSRPSASDAAHQLVRRRSRSVYTIHTYYQLQNGPEYFAEGLPSCFTGVTRVGAVPSRRSPIRVDSGDLVVSR